MKYSICSAEKNILETGKITLDQKVQTIDFSIVKLTNAHARAAHALHQTALSQLPIDQKAFMLDKSLAYFQQRLAAETSHTILGIVVNEELVGQAAITQPTRDDPKTGLANAALPAGAKPKDLSVMQAAYVSPDYRHHGLFNKLVNHWIEHAQQSGRTHVMAEIHADNTHSWRAFLHSSLHLVSLTKDPADGAPLYNAHNTLSEISRLRQDFKIAGGYKSCHVGERTRLADMMRDGYCVAHYYPKEKTFSLFHRPQPCSA